MITSGGRMVMKAKFVVLASLLILLILPQFVHSQNQNPQKLNLAPVCSDASLEPQVIWPPNGSFKKLQIKGVTDPDGDSVNIKAQCIIQDEPLRFWQKWFSYDGQGIGTDTPQVRATQKSWFFSFDDWKYVTSKGRTYEVVFSATDDKGASCVGKATTSVTVEQGVPVSDKGYRFESAKNSFNCSAKVINNPPIIYSVPVLEARAASPYAYQVKAHDPDKTPLRYQLKSVIDGMTIDEETGLINWTPTSEHKGVQAVQVAVVDAGGGEVTQSFEVTVVVPVNELSVSIEANPISGISPLPVGFTAQVQNGNIAIDKYEWDFDSDGIVDFSNDLDDLDQPRFYTYTGESGKVFIATLTITPSSGDPLVITKKITIINQATEASVSANVSNGYAPLAVTYTVLAKDPQGIKEIQIDFNGDGVIDDSQVNVDSSPTEGSWDFETNYTDQGQYQAIVTVTDVSGESINVISEDVMVNVGSVSASAEEGVTNENDSKPPLSTNGVESALDFNPASTKAQEADDNADNQWILPWNWRWSVDIGPANEEDKVPVVSPTESVSVPNNANDPIIRLSASAVEGPVEFNPVLTATAEIFDGSVISQWRWDLDGDGIYETTGGNGFTDAVNPSYKSVDFYYPSVEVRTNSGRIARTSLKITTTSVVATPTLTIPDASDTINAGSGEVSSFVVDLPYDTNLSVWVEDSAGVLVATVLDEKMTAKGLHNYQWNAQNSFGELVSEGDYYVVVGYEQYGLAQEVDLRTSTGGQLSYFNRTENNPRYFDRVEQPLLTNYEVDNPAEVSFFWQVSFGARLITLMDRERLGRGAYSLYWNGEYPNGKKVPFNLDLIPKIVRYDLPDNVIYVTEVPRIESFKLSSTWVVDPRREPIGLELLLSKTSTIELVVSDMEQGVDVANRVYNNIPAGEQILEWDGKNDAGQYLAPRDYRVGIRSVDEKGNRSPFLYRTQRIDY